MRGRSTMAVPKLHDSSYAADSFHPSGLSSAIVAVAAWGLSYIATEWLYTQGLGPFAVLTLRTFLAYAVLLLLSHKQLLADELRRS